MGFCYRERSRSAEANRRLTAAAYRNQFGFAADDAKTFVFFILNILFFYKLNNIKCSTKIMNSLDNEQFFEKDVLETEPIQIYPNITKLVNYCYEIPALSS